MGEERLGLLIFILLQHPLISLFFFVSPGMPAPLSGLLHPMPSNPLRQSSGSSSIGSFTSPLSLSPLLPSLTPTPRMNQEHLLDTTLRMIIVHLWHLLSSQRHTFFKSWIVSCPQMLDNTEHTVDTWQMFEWKNKNPHAQVLHAFDLFNYTL